MNISTESCLSHGHTDMTDLHTAQLILQQAVERLISTSEFECTLNAVQQDSTSSLALIACSNATSLV